MRNQKLLSLDMIEPDTKRNGRNKNFSTITSQVGSMQKYSNGGKRSNSNLSNKTSKADLDAATIPVHLSKDKIDKKPK